jgi:hypothetical protein
VGAWFRVVVPPAKDEITIIGFLASNEVEILEEKTTPKPDFWAPESGQFQGIGIDLQVGAGFTYFESGNLNPGVRGMYDELAAVFAAMGYPILDKKNGPFQSGVHFAADVIYNLGPHLAVGLGTEYVHARRFDSFGFMVGINYQTAYSTPIFSALVFRPGVYYTIPLTQVLAVTLVGGPALFFTSYEYNRNASIPGAPYSVWEESLHQRGRKLILGAQAGAGLELHINKRTAFVLQTMGRFARSSNMTGEEKNLVMLQGQDIGPTYEGQLYFVPGGTYPRLAVRPDAPSSDARKAVVNFTGVDFTFGLRVKF